MSKLLPYEVTKDWRSEDCAVVARDLASTRYYDGIQTREVKDLLNEAVGILTEAIGLMRKPEQKTDDDKVVIPSFRAKERYDAGDIVRLYSEPAHEYPHPDDLDQPIRVATVVRAIEHPGNCTWVTEYEVREWDSPNETTEIQPGVIHKLASEEDIAAADEHLPPEGEAYGNIKRISRLIARTRGESDAPSVAASPVSYSEAIEVGRDLLSEHGENPEYDRGIVELIADCFGKSGMYLADAKSCVEDDLGVSGS